MKRPFPGMDPYLEAHWGDVHTRLIVYCGDQIRPKLPRDLKIRVEERISIQDPDRDERPEGYFPDVRIVERSASRLIPSAEAASSAVLTSDQIDEPVLVPRMVEAATERSLQIIDSRSGNRVVTTIEILSPANKVDGKGRAAYRRKQRLIAQAGINLVEIDLLREGSYVLIAPLELVPKACQGTYRVAVSRATDPENVEMYRVPLRQPLPTIRIPLRSDDSDVLLDLQSMIDKSYENGGYDDIDHATEPTPPLLMEDAEWADKLLREARYR